MHTLQDIFTGLIQAAAASVFILPIILLEASSSPGGPPVPRAVVPSAERVLEPHRVAENLIGHKWQRVGNQERGLAPELVTWEFYADGTFRWRFTSDYTLGYMGAWAISATSEDRGIIFLASTKNGRGPSSRFHVLSFEFRNGRFRLGESFYQGTPLTNRDVPPRIRKEDHQAVTRHHRNRFFSLWVAMTADDWRSESAPRPGDPDMYSFMRDGTYTAEFASTQCQYSGTWSLFSSAGDTGEIRFSIPANRCDPRGPRDAFVRGMPITIKNSKLSLYKTIYVSVPKRR